MKKIKTNEKTTVYATSKSKYLNEGRELKVHPVTAAKMIAKGFATAQAPKK